MEILNYINGDWIKPNVQEYFDVTNPATGQVIAQTPLCNAEDVDAAADEAIELVNTGRYGNQVSLFTSSGNAARRFRYEVEAGNIGINIGVAAPMAFFPFSGWKQSFYGDMHGQGMDAVEFFTQKKVVVERWPKEWSRRF